MSGFIKQSYNSTSYSNITWTYYVKFNSTPFVMKTHLGSSTTSLQYGSFSTLSVTNITKDSVLVEGTGTVYTGIQMFVEGY